MTPMEKLVAAERARERVGKAISGLSKLMNEAQGDGAVVLPIKECERALSYVAAVRRTDIREAEKELWGE